MATVLSLLMVNTLQASQWEIETVDSTGNVGGYTSIALDGAGRPHISYTGEGELRYSFHDESGWHVETVVSGVPGAHTSLALDDTGCPWIAYYDPTPPAVTCAFKPSATWCVEPIDTSLAGWGYPSIAFDSFGVPHVSYVRWLPPSYLEEIVHAVRDTSGWNTETAYAGEELRLTSLAVDSAGLPHIAFGEQVYYPGNVLHCWNDASGWHMDGVGGGTYCDGVSLGLDREGFPHVCYEATRPRYSYKDAYGWHGEWVDYHPVHVMRTCLALDGSDRPRVAYYDWGNENLKYAARIDGMWYPEVVDSVGNVGLATSIAVDAGGFPHIGYRDATNTDLKYARGILQLSVSLEEDQLVLTWADFAGASGYWVYGACNDAYFAPGFAPVYEHRLAVLPYTLLTWSTAGGVGDPDSNWSYLVLPMDAAEQELCRSNRAGEHDFATETD